MANYTGDSDTRGGKINKVTRPEVLDRTLKSIASQISDEKAKERRIARSKTQGNGKYIKDGSDDRINGCGYNANHLEKYPTEDDKKSYHYGYTTHGGRRLMYVVEQLLKQERYEEIALIAERDYNNGLKEEELGMVAKIPEYLETYRQIANKNKRK